MSAFIAAVALLCAAYAAWLAVETARYESVLSR